MLSARTTRWIREPPRSSLTSSPSMVCQRISSQGVSGGLPEDIKRRRLGGASSSKVRVKSQHVQHLAICLGFNAQDKPSREASPVTTVSPEPSRRKVQARIAIPIAPRMNDEELQYEGAESILAADLPLSAWEHPAVRNYLQKLCPTHKPPNRNRVRQLALAVNRESSRKSLKSMTSSRERPLDACLDMWPISCNGIPFKMCRSICCTWIATTPISPFAASKESFACSTLIYTCISGGIRRAKSHFLKAADEVSHVAQSIPCMVSSCGSDDAQQHSGTACFAQNGQGPWKRRDLRHCCWKVVDRAGEQTRSQPIFTPSSILT